VLDAGTAVREIAALDPTVVVVLESEPGWAWKRCPVCGEFRYHRRTNATTKCSVTPRCPGVMENYVVLNCLVCEKPVTARRRDLDVRFCSKKCEVAWPPKEAA
jgi:hypothetical protein